MMKKAVTSVDVHFLVDELSGLLVDGRVDGVYESGERTLVLEVFKSGSGKLSLVVAPHYLCVSGYKREKPNHPSSFVMQLRKRLKGCFVRSIIQHAFDRIVEVDLAGNDGSYVIILEVFSKGNVILCDSERKIIGLLEWQKWRDRKLGVGQPYEYPPETVNPLTLSGGDVSEILAASERDLVRALAVECGLGGVYAEEVCLRSGVDKGVAAMKIDGGNDVLIEAFLGFVAEVSSRKSSPRTVFEGETSVDVVPLALMRFSGAETVENDSFTKIVDDFFSVRDFTEKKKVYDSKYAGEKKKLEKRLSDQEGALTKAKENSVKYQEVGDALFGRMHEVQPLIKKIGVLRKQGLSDKQILAELEGLGLLKGLNKTELILDI